MNLNYRSHHLLFIIAAAAIVIGLTISPFTNASCSTTQQIAQTGTAAALERLRSLAHSTPPVAEPVIERFEIENRGTTVAALARLLRARLKSERAGDHAGGAALLDDAIFKTQTAIPDYALFTRAALLDKAGRVVEARALYEQVARDYPSSLRARPALLRAAEIVAGLPDGARAVPLLVHPLVERDDATALLLAARAAEATGERDDAIARYRRIFFYAPATPESALALQSLTRIGAPPAPVNAGEALTRADKLFAARRYADAADAYADAFRRFPALATPQAQLRRGTSAANARRLPEAASVLRAIPASATDTRAEALQTLTVAYARGRILSEAQRTLDEMRRLYPQHEQTMLALVRAGNEAKTAKNSFMAQNFYRAAVNSFPGREEVAGAQFELAWAAHDAGNFNESSRLLVEHLANYADRNTDNRGRAGYWAARDSERAGRIADARALYAAMLARYDANWYGYLAKQRLDTLNRTAPAANSTSNELITRAVANLSTITVNDSTISPEDETTVMRAVQLGVAGLDDYAFAELNALSAEHPLDPRVNLATAQLRRARGENVQALLTLARSFPDYAQMKPEEMTRDEWDIFYPLHHWNIIRREARAKNLDPFTVAGLIRQESVFDPRAASSANAYGLMQLLVPTARSMAQAYGVDRTITSNTLFDPDLNITLGTGYMRKQFDEFGRLEYVAAAYNAGPGRPRAWRTTLPLQIDEWTEAIPFRETRGYVQGVIRNMLQYRRLYDENGQFRPEVGARAAARTSPTNATVGAPDATNASRPATTPQDGVRPRRATTPETMPELQEEQ